MLSLENYLGLWSVFGKEGSVPCMCEFQHMKVARQGGHFKESLALGVPSLMGMN